MRLKFWPAWFMILCTTFLFVTLAEIAIVIANRSDKQICQLVSLTHGNGYSEYFRSFVE